MRREISRGTAAALAEAGLKVLLSSAALPLTAALPVSPASAQPVIELASTIVLPGVHGRIDHLAMDLKSRRVFVAALGNDTVEVIEADGGHHRSIRGFREPQGIAHALESNRVLVANGEGARVDIVDASSLAVLGRIEGLEDADNVRYDAGSRMVLVGYGKGALAIVDPATARLVARIPLPGHPESFQLERDGPRVFVNVPSAHQVVVVDRVKRQTVARWDLPDVGGNYPMALDDEGHRLFVGARSPAAMLVIDTSSGRVVARVAIGGDADDMFFDAARKRIYVVCGEGRIDVIRQDTPDVYSRESSIETARRARTGLFVAEARTLFVAAPAVGATPARILAYRIR